jgi:hypothetical protein
MANFVTNAKHTIIFVIYHGLIKILVIHALSQEHRTCATFLIPSKVEEPLFDGDDGETYLEEEQFDEGKEIEIEEVNIVEKMIHRKLKMKRRVKKRNNQWSQKK